MPSLNPSAHPRIRKLSFGSDQKEWVSNAIRNGNRGSTASSIASALKVEMKLRQKIHESDEQEIGEISETEEDNVVLVTSQDIRNFQKKIELTALNGKTEIEVCYSFER